MASDAARDPHPAPEDIAGPVMPPTVNVSSAEPADPRQLHASSSSAHTTDASASMPPVVPPRSVSPAAAATERSPLAGSYPAQYQVPPGGAAAVPPQAGAGAFPFPYGNGADASYNAAAAVDAGAAGPKNFNQKMAGSDEHWQWKLGLRILLCVIDIIGIGCVAAVTADNFLSDYNWYYFEDTYIMPFCLIPLALSFIWCMVVILVLLLRKPPRPVHPGVAVGLDLVLWLAFIFTLLFTIAAVLSVTQFGSDPNDLDDPYGYSGSYSGGYSLAPNGTWVYKISRTYGYYDNLVEKPTATASSASAPSLIDTVLTSDAFVTPTATAATGAAKRAIFTSVSSSTSYYDPYDYYSYPTQTASDNDYYGYPYGDDTFPGVTTDSDGFYYYVTATSTRTRSAPAVTRTCSPTFTSCAQQDEFVNALWQAKPRRQALDETAAAMQGLAVILHFALFVWACVDTHRRNRSQRNTAMTLNLLQDMRQRGYVMVPAGDAAAAAAVAPPVVVSPGFAPAGYPTAGYPAAAAPQEGMMFPYPPPPAGAAGQVQPPAWPSSSRAAEKAPAGPSMTRYG